MVEQMNTPAPVEQPPMPNRREKKRSRSTAESRGKNAEQRRVEREIDRYEEKRDRIDHVEKAEMKRTITRNLKNDLTMKSRAAEEVSKEAEIAKGQMTGDSYIEARSIEESLNLFISAAREGLVDKPSDPVSAKFFDHLVTNLSQGITTKDAAYFQPIIAGLLNNPSYVRFSREGQEPTQFEKDLRKIVGTGNGSNAEYAVASILNDLLQQGVDIGTTRDEFESKRAQARQERTAAVDEERETMIEEASKRGRRAGQEDEYLLNLLDRGGTGNEDSTRAREMLSHMESPEAFKQYFKQVYDRMMSSNERVQEITDPEKRMKRASKEATHEIHRTLLFMVHKIFAPVIDGGSKKPFAQLVQDATSGGYMLNPQTVFFNLRKKIMYLAHPISERDIQWSDEGVTYYQYKNTKTKSWITANKEEDESVKAKATTTIGKYVEETESMELKEGSFKEFLENMHLSIDAEKDLLETGINFNYLMSTGQTQEQQSFFQQAASYAKQTLPANRLDELYKLPFADLVEAAKIQLSSYYKKKFAMNNWKKNPEILLGLFENMNEVENEALKDMIHNFGDKPEWIIKRALIHARMHLSLVNLEMHALSSYAHATLDDFGKPTYRDQALKSLDVFRTWYNGEMWQVSDAFVKGMAFMPQPTHDWKIDEWVHEDITDEGKDIFEQSFLLGKMAATDRTNYKNGMLPNIMELNPMGNGGVEIQLGWRMKYGLYPWIEDMLDHLNNENKFDLSDSKDPRHKALEHGWKRLENISANALKIYRDEFLFEGDYLKQGKDGSVAREKHYEQFFKFLYKRYFKEGLGKQGFGFEHINSEQEFWENVIQPILHKKVIVGEGESESDAKKRNTSERTGELKSIVDDALAVVAFERVPMDFVFMESSSRSQNGVTLLQELQDHYDKKKDNLHMTPADLDNTFDDILYVQQRARTDSIRIMDDHVSRQSDAGKKVKVLYGRSLESLDDDRSDIELIQGQQKKGYVVSVEVIRGFLKEKYERIPNLTPEQREQYVNRAVDLYNEVQQRMLSKPIENPHELDPTVTETRLRMKMKERGLNYENKDLREKFKNEFTDELAETYRRYRDENITKRIQWSKDEIIGSTTAMPINDTAYQYIEFVKGGRDMVQRSLGAVASMQERYKNDVNGGELLSALKKYYRKEDGEELHKLITEMRSSIKDEDEGAANTMAMRVLENSVNVMRINSDAENMLVDLQYQAAHKPRSAFSVVVKEGPEFPLRRSDRYAIVKDFLHYSQFPKRAKASDQVYEYEPSFQEKWKESGWLGEKVGQIADTLFGTKDGKMVRKRWKEMSGEGLRDREIANIFALVVREGPKYLALVMLAILILSMKKGFDDSEQG